MNKKILSIDGLRGYLILFIVLYHFTSRYLHYGDAVFPWNIGFKEGKDIGNVGFLILSGYFLTKNLFSFDTISKSQLFGFIWKKLKKLYIPFVIAVLFLWLIKTLFPFLENISNITFLKNIFLFRLFTRVPLVDGAHWYFFALIQLIIILSFSFYFYRNNKYVPAILVFCSLVFLKYYLILSVSTPYLLFFIEGGVLLVNNRYKWLIYIILSSLSISILSNYWVILVCIIIPILLFCNSGKQFIGLIFENKIILLIGKYSFMWYLVHQQLGYFFITYLSENGINCYLTLCISISTTFLIAIALHQIATKTIKMIKI